MIKSEEILEIKQRILHIPFLTKPNIRVKKLQVALFLWVENYWYNLYMLIISKENQDMYISSRMRSA